MTRMLLVRHGESEWNAAGRWQGQADPPLSERGRAQARAATERVGAVDAIAASDLQRALETATLISAALGVGPVLTDPDLRERHAGEWQGLTRAEIHEQWPGYLPQAPPTGRTAGKGRRPPSWEPDKPFLERALRAIRRVAAGAPGGEVLVVTHGGLIYALEGHLGGDGGRIANLEGRWIEVDGSQLHLGDRVALVDPADAPTIAPEQI